MRRLRPCPLEDLLLTQAIPGFFLAIAWTAMYEVYHDEGSYYTTLLQEVLGEEGLFPYFLISAVLMAFPVGAVVDSLRYVIGEIWLGRSHFHSGRAPASPMDWLEQPGTLPVDFEKRYMLYRHAWATLLTPAKTAGNMALVLLVLTLWSLVKIVRMGGWHVFSVVFVIGTPIMGLGLTAALLVRYTSGVAEFQRRVQESIFPSKETVLPAAVEHTPPSIT